MADEFNDLTYRFSIFNTYWKNMVRLWNAKKMRAAYYPDNYWDLWDQSLRYADNEF